MQDGGRGAGGFGLRLARTLLRASLAVEHISASDFVVATAHQSELDLVLDVLDMKRAAARPRAHQCPYDGLSETVDHLAHAGRSRSLGSMNRKKRLHHRDGNLVRSKRHHRAIAPDDLVMRQRRDRRLAGNLGKGVTGEAPGGSRSRVQGDLHGFLFVLEISC